MKAIAFSCSLATLAFLAWRHFQPTGIVFYQGFVVAMVFATAQMLWARVMRSEANSVLLKDGALTFLFLYALMFTVPTTVDRAYSVRMILEIEKAPQGLTKAQIQQWFATDFQSQGGVDKRLREQIATGSLKQNGSRFELTPFGHVLAQTFAGLRWLFANSGNERPIEVPSAAPAASKTPT